MSLFELFNALITQRESVVTMSLVAPTMLGIFYDLERELYSSSVLLTSLCATLISSMKVRFSGLLRHFNFDVFFGYYSMSERFCDPVFLIAPLFDTRFKLLWLENLHSSVKTLAIEKVRISFVQFFSKLNFASLRREVAEISKINEHCHQDISMDRKNASTKRKCLFLYFNEVKKVTPTSSDKSKILTELDAYLCEENSKKNLIFEKKALYPCLYQLGLKYLSIPATSAPIERIFSQSGFVMWSHRAPLTAKNVCLLIFLKCNKSLL